MVNNGQHKGYQRIDKVCQVCKEQATYYVESDMDNEKGSILWFCDAHKLK